MPISIGEDPVQKTVELVDASYACGADSFLIDLSCVDRYFPNLELMAQILHGIHDSQPKRPVMVRVPPQKNVEQSKPPMDIIRISNIVSAVFTTTAPSGQAEYVREKQAALQTAWAVTHLQQNRHDGDGTVGSIDVVSSGAIASRKVLEFRLGSGAVAGCGSELYIGQSIETWKAITEQFLSGRDINSIIVTV